MELLSALVRGLPEYPRLLEAAKAGQTTSVYGASPVHRAHLTAALLSDLPQRTFCVVLRDEQAAKTFAADLQALSGIEPALLPCRDLVFHNMEGVSHEYEQQRLSALWQIKTGKTRVLCAPADALMLRTLPPDGLENAAMTLLSDGSYPVERLVERLLLAGYTRTSQVEGPGQFALRGGILDVFPAGDTQPIRAEFWGDDVDSLGRFDPLTQRRSEPVSSVTILPVREALPTLAEGGIDGLCAALRKLAGRKTTSDKLEKTLLSDADALAELRYLPAADRYLPQIYPELATAFSYLPEDTVFVCCDTPAVLESAQGMAHRQAEDLTHLLEEGLVPPTKSGYGLDERQFQAALRKPLLLDSFLAGSTFSPEVLISLTAKQLSASAGGLDNLLRDLTDYLRMDYTVVLLAGGRSRVQNLLQLLGEENLPCVTDLQQAGPKKICLVPAALSAGAEYPALKTVFFCESGQTVRKTGKKRKSSNKDHIKSFSDLHPGDLVVHEHHGIGRFVGVE